MIATRRAWDGGIQVGTDSYGGEFDPAVSPAPTAVLALGEQVITAFSVDSVEQGNTRFVPAVSEATSPFLRHRVRVGGKDVSFFRGVPTPMPRFGLVEPLLYWSGTLTLPQINAALERPGHGALSWLRRWATVIVELVDADNVVVKRLYKGFITDYQHDGTALTCTLAGEATGAGDLADRPEIPFPTNVDIGTQVMSCLRRRMLVPTGKAPTTGIVFPEAGGVGSELDFVNDLLAKSTTLGGSQWTVMPNSKGIYQMFRKDVETIDATLYIEGQWCVPSLRRDFTQEFNRVFVNAVTPDGMRIRNAKFPGYGSSTVPDFPGSLSPGDDGDGVLALKWQLNIGGYLDNPFVDWTTDDDDPVTQAVMDLQQDAGLSQTGVVNAATWRAAYNVAVIGGGLRGAFIAPMAAKPTTYAYLRNAVGQVIGRNPLYDKTVRRVDLTLAMGRVGSADQAKKFAKQKLAPESNWTGTIRVRRGAVIDGEHNPGDPLDSSMVRDARTLLPGSNLWVPNWDGGTLFHISGSDIDGEVTYAVDTQSRDALEVWAIRKRNRESRINASRSRSGLRRRTAQADDTGAFYDGGKFGLIRRTFCPANTWTMIETPAGRAGMFQRIDIATDSDPAAFCMNLWEFNRQADWLERHLGDPFDDGFDDHFDAHIDDWMDNRGLLEHWGTAAQPCGYGRRKHTKDDGTLSDAPIIGRFATGSGISYRTSGTSGMLRLGIYPDRDTYVQGGRILTLLLDDSAS